jgi:hypothetical protein
VGHAQLASVGAATQAEKTNRPCQPVANCSIWPDALTGGSDRHHGKGVTEAQDCFASMARAHLGLDVRKVRTVTAAGLEAEGAVAGHRRLGGVLREVCQSEGALYGPGCGGEAHVHGGCSPYPGASRAKGCGSANSAAATLLPPMGRYPMPQPVRPGPRGRPRERTERPAPTHLDPRRRGGSRRPGQAARSPKCVTAEIQSSLTTAASLLGTVGLPLVAVRARSPGL